MNAKRLLRAVGLRGLGAAVLGKVVRRGRPVQVRVPGGGPSLAVRMLSHDVHVIEQVFVRREYEFPMDPAPRVIIDAGAHIGIAAVSFALRFPEARIIALEPDQENFGLLRRNASPFPQITPVHAALWHVEEDLEVVDTGLGSWGYRTTPVGRHPETAAVRHRIPAVTLSGVMATFRIDQIDLLKVDVEGAEREVFRDSSAWIDRVGVVAIELHEGLSPGATRAVYGGTRGLEVEWTQGENLIRARQGRAAKGP